MAITLRQLTPPNPDFALSATELSYAQMDQNFIDLYNAIGTLANPLPDITPADYNKFLRIDNGGNLIWAIGEALPAGGLTGDIVIKQSNTDGDYQWVTLGGDVTDVNTNGSISIEREKAIKFQKNNLSEQIIGFYGQINFIANHFIATEINSLIFSVKNGGSFTTTSFSNLINWASGGTVSGLPTPPTPTTYWELKIQAVFVGSFEGSSSILLRYNKIYA